MCLLIVAWKVDDTFPLIIGANRDERYDRPTTTFTALSSGRPRVLGGRDELAGGTWLAVSDRGIVAGLTNLFSVAGPDPTKRTRGELPLRLVQYSSASKGVADLSRRYSSSAYNGAAMFVGDRDFLFYIELGTNPDFTVLEMDPGIYVLENVPLNATSAKVDFAKDTLIFKDGVGQISLVGPTLGPFQSRASGLNNHGWRFRFVASHKCAVRTFFGAGHALVLPHPSARQSFVANRGFHRRRSTLLSRICRRQ